LAGWERYYYEKNVMRKLIVIICLTLCLMPQSTLAVNSAAVVLRKGDGTYKTACINFDTDTISGYQALQLADWNPELDNGFVIAIDNERAKANYEAGSEDDYWSYWQVKNSQWRYSAVGAKSSKISDGAVEGWQRGTSELKLKVITFEDVCINTGTPSDTSDTTVLATPVIDSPPPTPAKSTAATTPSTQNNNSDDSVLTPINNTQDSTIVEATPPPTVHQNSTPYIVVTVLLSLAIIIITLQLLRKQSPRKS